MTDALRVRRWNGLTIPDPGVFHIDEQHTTVGFVAQHLMVTQVRGRFEKVEAAIHVASDPLESFAHATILTDSITTGTEDRDTHLRSADFLDVERFPTVTFVSREITASSGGGPKWTMVNGAMRRRRRDPSVISAVGDLTIKDVTQPIELEVIVDGVTRDPWGGERLAFSARGEIDREAYGMTWNVALEAGGWLVSRRVQIEIRAQAVRRE